jgi:hypothetical protein
MAAKTARRAETIAQELFAGVTDTIREAARGFRRTAASRPRTSSAPASTAWVRSSRPEEPHVMASEYRHNHYVPVWYQKRFLPPGQADRELQYLGFQPGFFIDGRGVRHEKRSVRRQGFRFCFAQDDFYTVNFQGVDGLHPGRAELLRARGQQRQRGRGVPGRL